MKTLLLVLLSASFAFADSVIVYKNISASVSFTENEGVGDNAFGFFRGPGTLIEDEGGTQCTYCFVLNDTFSPGQSVNGSFSVGYDDPGGTELLGGKIYGPLVFSVGSNNITTTTFTFPAHPSGNGIFTITLPASMGDLFGGAKGQAFALQIKPGKLKLNFFFTPGGNGSPPQYQFDDALYVSTPEPATWLGLLTGFGGIGVIVKKRFGKRIARC